jgi:acyl-coenzyme A thioesterase PaaI-like protein
LTITHHELCFGCGLANLFGLQLEVERDGDRRVAGRFFVKQDHQGPPGVTHGGIVATALDEAMALLAHDMEERTLTRRLEVDLLAPAPIGSMAYVRAWVEDDDGRTLRLAADLRSEASGEAVLGSARGVFVRVRS